jgi:hypothetical protein
MANRAGDHTALIRAKKEKRFGEKDRGSSTINC